MSLRDDVDRILPGWESWYPSLFHAAEDLGLIRARVCAPSSLMISTRHAALYNEAVQAFRKQWSAEESEGEAQILPFTKSNAKRRETQQQRHSGDAQQRLSARNQSLSDAGQDALDHLAENDEDLHLHDDEQGDFDADE